MYEAHRISTIIHIDGILTDAAWQAAPWTHDFVDIRGFDWPTPRFLTRAKMVWDQDALYVAAELTEPHLWATLTERDQIVWRDDDFEVFLDPDGDGLNYFEIEINPLGTILDLFLARPYNKGGSAEIDWNLKGLVATVDLLGTINDPSDLDEGWTVEMAIPWRGLTPPPDGYALPRGLASDRPEPAGSSSGASAHRPSESSPVPGGSSRAPLVPQVGELWRMNMSRVDWPLLIEEGLYVKERELVNWDDHPEENWVWSPQGEINMHVPERWGYLRFVETAHGSSRHTRGGSNARSELPTGVNPDPETDELACPDVPDSRSGQLPSSQHLSDPDPSR